jgi:signal transduction histidine kinase
MKGSISRKYALWFSAVSLFILATVLLTTAVFIAKSSSRLRESLREGTTENYAAFQQTAMHNLAEFMRWELFTPLYELDIERIDRTLKDLRKGTPVKSIYIADDSGKVLTDGTDENPSYGMQLQLDRKRLATTPVLIEPSGADRRITFQIGIDEYLAGYGEIIYSQAAMREAITQQEATVLRIWRDFQKEFLGIAVVSAAGVGFLAVFISVFFSRTLTWPLIALRDASRRIAAGDLEHRVDIRSHDELGELAASFNNMSENLQKRTTELARTNEALQEAKEAAEAASAAKTEFLANMSHEMRTPLAGAMGMINLVMEMKLGMEERELLEMAKRSTDSLLRLISDLLDFSRLEAGAIQFEKGVFPLPEVVKTSIEVVSIQAREKGLRLLMEVDERVPKRVDGDEGRLRQVLVNLLGNSVKFTQHGEVEVSVGSFHDSEAQGRNFLLFSVRDTGIGIPPDQLERIFGKFTQVDASTTRKYGGAGLGLALSRQIVEKMGGRIWAESRIGEGSVFHFTYPLEPAYLARSE